MDITKTFLYVMAVLCLFAITLMLITSTGIESYIGISLAEVSPHRLPHYAVGVTRAEMNRTRTTHARGDVIDANRSRTATQQRSGRCRYKIQVYDIPERLPKKSFRSVMRQVIGKPLEWTNVTCADYDCDVQLILSPDKKYLGMDAVVFHFLKLLIPSPIPRADMNPNQAWIYFSRESPYSNSYEGRRLGDLPVHATWTYHRASEVYFPYGQYKSGQAMANHTRSVEDWLKGKTKLVAWMASNCGFTTWPRMRFVTELKKHIPVDAYGGCGNLTCSPKDTANCLRKYKFYLSIENSESGEYITEKVWRKPLLEGVVPIVYGPRRRDYEELLPPNSFIYLGDFKSIKDLAEYLRMLDSKPELYVKYLEWQYKGSVEADFIHRPTRFCDFIPVIEKVKRGEMKRFPVKTSKFYSSLRKRKKSNNSSFGLGNWIPWC